MPFKLGKGNKAIVLPSSVGLPAAAIILGPITALLSTNLITPASLAGLEEYLDDDLFVGLAGIALGAVALFYFLADRIRDANKALTTPAADAARAKANGLEAATLNFLIAFVFAISGLIAVFCLDGIAQAKFDFVEGHAISHLTLWDMVRSYVPATIEIVAGSLALIVVLIQLVVGGLRLVGALISL